MRCLQRNKQSIYYANVSTTTKLYDEYGNETGEVSVTYTTPAQIYANVSPASGEDYLSPVGVSADYSHTIVTDDMTLTITPTSLLWIGVPNTDRANFAVVRVAKSLNSLTIYCKELYT